MQQNKLQAPHPELKPPAPAVGPACSEVGKLSVGVTFDDEKSLGDDEPCDEKFRSVPS